jgi:hypothetical protein
MEGLGIAHRHGTLLESETRLDFATTTSLYERRLREELPYPAAPTD